MRYRLQRHDGTDCSATMVPFTVLRLVPIQRYCHWMSMRIPSAIEIESILWASMRFCHVWAIPGNRIALRSDKIFSIVVPFLW